MSYEISTFLLISADVFNELDFICLILMVPSCDVNIFQFNNKNTMKLLVSGLPVPNYLIIRTALITIEKYQITN